MKEVIIEFFIVWLVFFILWIEEGRGRCKGLEKSYFGSKDNERRCCLFLGVGIR